jgi:hypothetical protein
MAPIGNVKIGKPLEILKISGEEERIMDEGHGGDLESIVAMRMCC